MRKLVLINLFISVFFANAQLQNTLLWKFYKKGEKPSYLYGTYHSRKITHTDYHDSLDAKIRTIDRLYVEVVQSDMEKGSMNMISSLVLPKGKSLKTLMTKKQYASYAKYAENKLGSIYTNFDRMNPLFVSVFMGLMDEIELSEDTSLKTVDNYIETYAKANKKEVNGLETVQEQVDALNKISYKDGVDCLMSSIEDTTLSNKLENQLVTYYKNQQLIKIEQMTHEKDIKKSMKMMQDPLLDGRNKLMVEKIDTYLSSNSKKSIMVAVGAMHLIGKTGLIESLKSKGYIVEPILVY